MNHKGISPILATVIIIALTIVFAAFFLSWIKNLNKNVLDNSMCENNINIECLKLNFKISNVEKIDGKIEVTLVSNSDVKVNNIALQAFSDKGVVASQYFEGSLETPALDRFEGKTFTINYTGDITEVIEIRAIAGLELKNDCTGFCDAVIKEVSF